MIVFVVALRFFFGRAGTSSLDAMADGYEDADNAQDARKLRDTAKSYRTRADRYFYLLSIVALAMILVSLIGRL